MRAVKHVLTLIESGQYAHCAGTVDIITLAKCNDLTVCSGFSITLFLKQ